MNVGVTTTRNADHSSKRWYPTTPQRTRAILQEHGAITVVECWGDDVPEGKLTSFPMAVQRKPDETVVFGWITWSSREARDAGMKKATDDERLKKIEMPLDGSRMIFGGFKSFITL